MSIEVQNIGKAFGNFIALKDVSFQVPTGELVALLGPSGSGKTTLLRIIAGLEVADQGTILFHGEDATERSVRDRQVGFVFQHYALFRHLTVLENIAFGLRVRPRRGRPSDREIRARVHELLKLVQLDWLADRVVIMNEGRVEQIGTPAEVYDHPATPFVCHFLGDVNLFHGRIHEGQARIGDIELAVPEHAGTQDAPAVGYARPYDIEVTRTRNGAAALVATVAHVQLIGPLVHVELTREDTGDLIEVVLSKDRYQEMTLQAGEQVFVTPRNLRVFVQDGQLAPSI
ncbi:MAG: sulfate/molybdate ABC transporter ATP-binding protein [Candidatus Binatia bacterium]